MEKLNQIVFSENTIGGGESRSIRFDGAIQKENQTLIKINRTRCEVFEEENFLREKLNRRKLKIQFHDDSSLFERSSSSRDIIGREIFKRGRNYSSANNFDERFRVLRLSRTKTRGV